jgi:hypothetical protein
VQGTERVCFDGGKERLLQCSPVKDTVGCPPAFAGQAADRDMGDRLQRQAGDEPDPLGLRPDRLQRRQHAEIGKDAGRIRRNLQAGADLAKLGSFLEDIGRDAVTRKRKSSGQPRDAGADDRYFFNGHAVGLRVRLPSRGRRSRADWYARA